MSNHPTVEPLCLILRTAASIQSFKCSPPLLDISKIALITSMAKDR